MKTAAAPAAIALALLISACGSESDADSGPTVSATTGVLADISERIAGEDARVEQAIPEGSSPHDFQLSASDRAEIDDSILLVHNGLGLEPGVPVDQVEAPAFALTDHAGELLRSEGPGDHGDEEGEEHAKEGDEHAEEGGGLDPHVWMDPTRVASALPALAEALAEADPEHADGYRSRAERYATELRALDRELRESLNAVPEGERRLVTSHDALGYFADRYGFRVVATPFPASGVEAEASAARIRDVEAAVRRTGVPAVFATDGDNPEVLEMIAGDTGVEVVDELLVESPGSVGGYVEMLRHDAELIARALSPSTNGE